MDAAALLDAAADNHRSWFRRSAAAGGGQVLRRDDLDLTLDGRRHVTLAFPPPAVRSRAGIARLLDDAVALGARTAACWSLRPDDALGVELLARGFEWGWEPHWMAVAIARLPSGEAAWPVADAPSDARRTRRLIARDADREVAGTVTCNPWKGIAGIYDMWVAEGRRRQGIGRSLLLATGAAARAAGCSHAVLNATDDGERLYRTLGFTSLGKGQTWWMHEGPRPSERQSELVRAFGGGDLDALAALAPSRHELGAYIPGPGVPLAIAVVLRRPAVADWILARAPDLVSRAVEERGGTLLHVAVERDDEAMLRVALGHGADRDARDRRWNATPLEWATFLGHERMADILQEWTPST